MTFVLLVQHLKYTILYKMFYHIFNYNKTDLSNHQPSCIDIIMYLGLHEYLVVCHIFEKQMDRNATFKKLILSRVVQTDQQKLCLSWKREGWLFKGQFESVLASYWSFSTSNSTVTVPNKL